MSTRHIAVSHDLLGVQETVYEYLNFVVSMVGNTKRRSIASTKAWLMRRRTHFSRKIKNKTYHTFILKRQNRMA